MMNFQDSFKNLFDVNAWQENLSKAYDMNAAQEAMQKFYDVEAMQENFKKLYNLDAFQQNLEKLVDVSAFENAKEYFESLANQELAQDNLKLAANFVATNVGSVTDAVILQSVQVRDSIEDALEQVDALAASKDLEAALATQKKFIEEQQEVALENFWNKAGILSALVESNMNLAKEVFAKAQPAKQAA